MEDVMNESFYQIELNADNIIGGDDVEREPAPTPKEVKAHREKLLIKAHSGILRAC
jgi:hypothetical protein